MSTDLVLRLLTSVNIIELKNLDGRDSSISLRVVPERASIGTGEQTSRRHVLSITHLKLMTPPNIAVGSFLEVSQG